MLFCHRGSKTSTPPSPSQKPHDLPSSQFQSSQINNVNMEQWQLPSILTAGSLDELRASNPLLPEAPDMPATMEAQLATLSNREENGKAEGRKGRSSNRCSQQLLSSASMHSLMSSVTSQDYNPGRISKDSGTLLSNVMDGNLSLPITHKKHHHYSGLSLLSLSHHRLGSSTFRKLRSLDVQQFSSLLDFEERYNDTWVGSISLRRTAKPNLENERHRENSLFLSILEAKGLQNKRRYYCDVCLDRTLYARTTSKQSTGNSIFWAEEFDLNNLPDVSILTVSLYREADSAAKDGRRGLLARSNSKRTSKKSQNRLIGFVTLPVSNVCTRNPAQTWLTLQPPANADSINPVLLSPSEIGGNGITFAASNSSIATSNVFITTGGANTTTQGTGVQLRVSVRYKSVEILPISAYDPLQTLVRENGIEMTDWFEHLIPLKLKEEVASCLVNLHERNGTAAAFLTELVVNEVSNLENESMTFRSNTMATKAVESYIKLVGKEYLHSLLYRYIQRVLACPETWEVDPDKLSPSNLSSGSLLSPDHQGTSAPATLIIQEYCARKSSPSGCSSDVPGNGLSRLAVLSSGKVAQPGSLVYSQTQLLQHLDFVWEAVCASFPIFPRPLLEVFSSFRAALQPSKGAEFCDKLISACIFLRFVCPAILTPSLFGLASTFPGESSCQRNLTLVAKSLQSLANLSTFGDKESFMRFMNAYVEVQIPTMRRFLRDISSLSEVLERSETVSSPVASTIDCGYELACLQNICQELFSTQVGQQNTSNTSSVFGAGNGMSPIDSLPPSLARLPEIVAHLENVKNGAVLRTDFVNGHIASDSAYAFADSSRRAPASTVADPSFFSVNSESINLLPCFYLSMEESMGDSSSAAMPRQPVPDPNALGSPITKPRAIRPVIARLPAVSLSDNDQNHHPYVQQPPSFLDVMTSPKKGVPFEEDGVDHASLKKSLKAPSFIQNTIASGGGGCGTLRNDVDYDDPYIDDAYDSTHVSRIRTIHDASCEEGEKSGSGRHVSSSGGVSPIHALQFPSPPHSAFSLYRRPRISNSPSSGGAPSGEVEFSSSPAAVPSPTTAAISRTPSGVSSAEGPQQTSPRKSYEHHSSHHHHHHYHQAATVRDIFKATSLTTPSCENLILEPRPNPIITHFKPYNPRSSTTLSSYGRSSCTNKQDLIVQPIQHHYPYRQVVSPNDPSAITSLTKTSSKSVDQKMSSSVTRTLLPADNDFGTNIPLGPATDDLGTMETSGWSWTFEADSSRRPPSAKKSNGLPVFRGHGAPPQPVLAENEQLLTSTLEELGDAVAWLERERNDLLNMQERRLSTKRPRSRTMQSIICGPPTLPSANPAPAIHASIVYGNSPPSVPSSTAATQPCLHPHTSTPSTHPVNYTPSPTDETLILTKSTNSLIDQILPQQKIQRSAVSKTFTLTSSGSASASPSRGRRDSSESLDTFPSGQARHHRTATFVLNKPLATGSNGVMHRSSPQTPAGNRRLSNKTDELGFVALQSDRPRPHAASFVSTSNCNLFSTNHTTPNSPLHPPSSSAEVARPQRRTSGGVYILSSSSLIS